MFGNGKPEELLFFVQNFKVMLEDLGTLADSIRLQYPRTILHGETLNQFDALCDQVGSTDKTHLNHIFWV